MKFSCTIHLGLDQQIQCEFFSLGSSLCPFQLSLRIKIAKPDHNQSNPNLDAISVNYLHGLPASSLNVLLLLVWSTMKQGVD